jgi:hypothetical protein
VATPRQYERLHSLSHLPHHTAHRCTTSSSAAHTVCYPACTTQRNRRCKQNARKSQLHATAPRSMKAATACTTPESMKETLAAKASGRTGNGCADKPQRCPSIAAVCSSAVCALTSPKRDPARLLHSIHVCSRAVLCDDKPQMCHSKAAAIGPGPQTMVPRCLTQYFLYTAQ